MKKTIRAEKKQVINTIYTQLKAGKIVAVEGNHMSGTIWAGESVRNNAPLLFWQHFGSSAEKMNKKNLLFIINTIFECKNKIPVYKIVSGIYEQI